jgi:hypothetical protein
MDRKASAALELGGGCGFPGNGPRERRRESAGMVREERAERCGDEQHIHSWTLRWFSTGY